MVKEIKDFNGRYTISSNGIVYSNNKQMSPYLLNSGYYAIKLQLKGKRFNYLIHRLVAEYFIDNLNSYDIVDHIDGNRLNNNSNNLRWCSQKDNLYYHGFDNVKGIKHYASVFTKEDVQKIRQYRETLKLKNKEIYNFYPSISHTAIDQILNYKTYKL